MLPLYEMSNHSSSNQASNANHRRPTWAEIDLNALAENFRIVKERVGSDVNVMAVVKANAYGHGAVECARRLEREGADWFGVAMPEEGIELREAGITRPILCLAGFWEGQAAACVQYRLVPSVYRLDIIEAIDSAARERGEVADVHVKMDTGMGRLGVRFDEVADFVDALAFKNIRIDGLMTHFAAADEPSCGPLTHDQIQRFDNAVAVFRARGYELTHRHLANSAGIFGQPGAWGNMVRPGGVLYGVWRDILAPDDRNQKFHRVMSLHSRITLLKWVPAGETVGYGCTFEASSKTLVARVIKPWTCNHQRSFRHRHWADINGPHVDRCDRCSWRSTG